MEPLSQPLDLRLICGYRSVDCDGCLSFLSLLMRFVPVLIVAALSISAFPPHSREPEPAQEVLDRALHYADLYNWHAAGPLFERAEQMFRAAGEHRNELYAH